MRDGKERASSAHRRKSAGGAAMKLQLRRTAVAHDFNIAPQDILRVSRPERFHPGFFRGKTAREMNGRHAAARAASATTGVA